MCLFHWPWFSSEVSAIHMEKSDLKPPHPQYTHQTHLCTHVHAHVKSLILQACLEKCTGPCPSLPPAVERWAMIFKSTGLVLALSHMTSRHLSNQRTRTHTPCPAHSFSALAHSLGLVSVFAERGQIKLVHTDGCYISFSSDVAFERFWKRYPKGQPPVAPFQGLLFS